MNKETKCRILSITLTENVDTVKYNNGVIEDYLKYETK